MYICTYYHWQVSLCRQLLVVDPEAPHDLSSSKKAYTRIGFYKGTAVAIKYIHKKSIDLTRNIRKELKQVSRDLNACVSIL